MKRKSGLHKKVSSIFGETFSPDDSFVKTPHLSNDVADVDDAGTSSGNFSVSNVDKQSAKLKPHPATGLPRKTVTKTTIALTEDQEYEADQKKKLFLVVGLGVTFALVLFFGYYRPSKKAVAKPNVASAKIMGTKVSEIYWPKPKVWPEDIRDPMVFKENAAKLYALESKIKGPFILRGIVHKPEGRSMALLGTEIYYEGDEVDGWTI